MRPTEDPPATTAANDDDALLERTRAFAVGDPDPDTRAELERLVAERNLVELRERMRGPLVFGTAGLRARVGAGESRMNRGNVIRTTRGLADFLAAARPGARSLPVVVGHDARSTSAALARDVVAVLAAARIPVRWFEEPVPTPLVAFAARALSATAAIVITASHNPRDDNGYKVYLDDAIQLVAPHDRAIEHAIATVGPANSVPRQELAAIASTPPAFRVEAAPLPLHSWFERYLAEVVPGLGPREPDPSLRIAYTPLHGVGWRFASHALAYAGYQDVHVVPEQAEPDGTFPTTPFPNPEEPGTLELALAFAAEKQAHLLLANDPDADRLAVAVPTASGRWLRLSGNQLAVLLADARLGAGQRGAARQPLCVSSIVTTPLVEAVARAHGARFERTLTGFKWLWTAVLALERRGGVRFAYAAEEALGYSVSPAVRDKDGISAAIAVADLASRCRREGKSLLDHLHALERRHGVWASVPKNVDVDAASGSAAISAALDRLVASPPAMLGTRRVRAVRDYRVGAESRPAWLGAALLVELELDNGRVLVRPSGTEPKLKFYADLRAEAAPATAVSALEEELAAEAAALLDELAARMAAS
jgi:phosphomannomutase